MDAGVGLIIPLLLFLSNIEHSPTAMTSLGAFRLTLSRTAAQLARDRCRYAQYEAGILLSVTIVAGECEMRRGHISLTRKILLLQAPTAAPQPAIA